MNQIHIALFPALLLGILVIVFFASLADTSETVLGFSEPTNVVQDQQKETATSSNPVAAPSAQKIAPSRPTNCEISDRYSAKIRQWCSLITQYAVQHRIEPDLIAAVMLQESGGNPNAYSKSGAVGLMQVMPRDGLAAQFKCNGKPCFASRPTMDELFNPEYNIAYGVRMLAGLIQRTGSVRDALRAYGPMDVGYYYADKVLKIFDTYE